MVWQLRHGIWLCLRRKDAYLKLLGDSQAVLSVETQQCQLWRAVVKHVQHHTPVKHIHISDSTPRPLSPQQPPALYCVGSTCTACLQVSDWYGVQRVVCTAWLGCLELRYSLHLLMDSMILLLLC
jgi:hypothetical protein